MRVPYAIFLPLEIIKEKVGGLLVQNKVSGNVSEVPYTYTEIIHGVVIPMNGSKSDLKKKNKEWER